MVATVRTRKAAKDGPVVQLMRCGPCSVARHSSCIARIRNGFDSRGVRRFVDCSCCGDKTPRKCLDCGNRNADEVHPELWECTDTAVCLGRQDLKRQNSRTYQMIQAIKSELAIERRARRLRTAQTLARIPDNEDALIDLMVRPSRSGPRPPRVVRPTSGSCLCCGETTKGGQFLPGHDAKWKSVLRARAKAGDQDAVAILQERGWA